MVRDSQATESQQQKVNKSHDSRDPPSLSEETEVNIGIKVEVKLSTYTFTQNFRLLEWKMTELWLLKFLYLEVKVTTEAEVRFS